MALTPKQKEIMRVAGVSEADTMRLLPIAKAMTRRYCGESLIPEGVETEAWCRLVGYLAQTRHNPAILGRRVDDLSIRFSPKLSGIMTRSGAEALLSPFVKRRALS